MQTIGEKFERISSSADFWYVLKRLQNLSEKPKFITMSSVSYRQTRLIYALSTYIKRQTKLID